MRALIFILLCLFSRSVFADLALDKTRVIIDEHSSTGVFRVRNTGSSPVLVQSWVSGYTDDTDAGSSDAAAIPPVFRLMPGEIKSVRIVPFIRVQSNQEKLLSINVQQIPIVAAPSNKNTISVSMRMRFKLMVRGNKLFSSDIKDRISKLTCSVIHSDGENKITCLNLSGYHYIISGIKDSQKNINYTVVNDLIKPNARTIITVLEKNTFHYAVLELINDDGEIYNYSLKSNL